MNKIDNAEILDNLTNDLKELSCWLADHKLNGFMIIAVEDEANYFYVRDFTTSVSLLMYVVELQLYEMKQQITELYSKYKVKQKTKKQQQTDFLSSFDHTKGKGN